MAKKYENIYVQKNYNHPANANATNIDVVIKNSTFVFALFFNAVFYLLGLYRNCKEIKYALKTNQNNDYMMMVHGKPALVYCFKMDTPEPEEYISLQGNTGNYAEIYDRRLRNIDSCPYSGQRRDNCDCEQIGSDRSGLTNFYKVRLNVTSLEIIGTIFKK